MSEPIPTPIVCALSDDGAKPVVEQTLTPSFNVGIHLVRLADFGVRLAVGKHHRWFVLLASDSKRRSWDILAGATIERADPVGADVGAVVSNTMGPGLLQQLGLTEIADFDLNQRGQ